MTDAPKREGLAAELDALTDPNDIAQIILRKMRFDADRIHRLERLTGSILTWAEQRCPCENDEPNPCPLCGAGVENLEACKSAENTLPRHLLQELRAARRVFDKHGRVEP